VTVLAEHPVPLTMPIKMRWDFKRGAFIREVCTPPSSKFPTFKTLLDNPPENPL
jgi:hypothetical protein